MMLDRLERAFERIVDGAVAGMFRLRVQPAEIGRQLERAMLDGRANSVGKTLAPNRFLVTLHPDDAAAFADWNGALCREMETWLATLAFERGLTLLGPIQVGMTSDIAVPRRAVRAIGEFADGHAGASMPADAERHAKLALRLVPEDPSMPSAILAGHALTVGRTTGNDVMLAASDVSRFHARLEPDGGGWRVVDLGSTNGTWLNGRAVREAPFGPGDRLAFAGVRFRVARG
jgi:hypothetical protein